VEGGLIIKICVEFAVKRFDITNAAAIITVVIYLALLLRYQP
jgi:hypothetical protein